MPSPQTHRDVPPLPPPSTFSILPDIYILLARLNLLHQPQLNGHSQSQSQSSQTQTSSTQHLPSQTHSAATVTGSQIPASILNGASLLELKDLPGQIYPLRQKLARARAAVEELPDVERTVEEQEAEIRKLEAMVRALKTRLGALGAIAREKADVEMTEQEEG
ncbi:hypothetical protein A1O7_04279 [Cladophialophora yegresii CBS 114405]|uniref:Mediator of RNA polymerase II transcription subunit 9 n=1 Tax=Cladophialophora yegresii CBS 114405 TaxID=1182544 RepID=W9VWB2_9EURO|nr:uncharacterized protein A1O7_04279 [Cladophialophora yegresii CBS 114405]EXJ60127.1 hypothetical protein A1O7_04279 [Cladophialophora yegresii CBS 114405]